MNTEVEWGRKGFPMKFHNFSQNVWGFENSPKIKIKGVI